MNQFVQGGSGRLRGRWFWLSSAAALLAAIGSVVGLSLPANIFGQETTVLADAATAQDLVNLLLVAPLLVVLGWRAHRGHIRAHLVWVGCLAFTVYNYAIYAFSIHFGPLFLVWVAVLGLSMFTLIGGGHRPHRSDTPSQHCCTGMAAPTGEHRPGTRTRSTPPRTTTDTAPHPRLKCPKFDAGS